MPCHAGPRGKAPGFVRRQKSEEKAWSRGFNVFSVGKARLGRVNSLGLDDLNNVSRLWATEVGSSCLVPT